MRIHITYTGGTIGMIDSPNGLIPGADTRGWLFRLLEDAHMDASLFTFTELDPLIECDSRQLADDGRRFACAPR